MSDPIPEPQPEPAPPPVFAGNNDPPEEPSMPEQPQNLPTAVQLDFLSQAAKTGSILGEAFASMRDLAEKAELMDELGNIGNRNFAETPGTFNGFDPTHLATLLAGLPAMGQLAAANNNALRRATFALAARNR